MQLTQKRIVITGATSGIGKELLKQLHVNNHIIAIGRDIDQLSALKAISSEIKCFQVDLADQLEVKKVVTGILDRYETIDILINNAAIQYVSHFMDQDYLYEHIQCEINTNLTAICSLCYLFLPTLSSNGKDGTIVNINSGLGLVPKTSSAVYCACKGAMNILSQSLRNQLMDQKVKVFQAFLPLVDTAMTKGRGVNKMPAREAAKNIILGIERNIEDHYIGKSKVLRMLMRASPKLAQSIMRRI